MNEYSKYAALADTIKIEDITSCKRKQGILKRLKEDDEDYTQLWICSKDQVHDDLDYDFDNAKELAWLGYYLGRNSMVKKLYISSDLTNNSGKDVFCRGLGNNKSIHQLSFELFDLATGQILRMLDQFINSNLSQIGLNECQLGTKGIRQLSLTIGDCNRSLKLFKFRGNEIEVGNIVDIITALSMHPQLERLGLADNRINMGRNECTALSTLLRCTTTQLQLLNLKGCDINDEGLDTLVKALPNTLRHLDLGSNRSITIKGWKVLSTLLATTDSNLNKLHIDNNNVGDDGALVFTNALVNNSTLKTLGLRNSGITNEGWAAFSRLLCDTSSVNRTYMSNHTLQKFRGSSVDALVNTYLALNKKEDKSLVAMTKILQHHSRFNMEPFFEWEFKVLPLMINWFANAARSVTTYDQKTSRLKLSATFDFIKEFPMLYVEPMTRQEIAEYTARRTVAGGSSGVGTVGRDSTVEGSCNEKALTLMDAR